jgi:hypothetical protein
VKKKKKKKRETTSPKRKKTSCCKSGTWVSLRSHQVDCAHGGV